MHEGTGSIAHEGPKVSRITDSDLHLQQETMQGKKHILVPEFSSKATRAELQDLTVSCAVVRLRV